MIRVNIRKEPEVIYRPKRNTLSCDKNGPGKHYKETIETQNKIFIKAARAMLESRGIFPDSGCITFGKGRGRPKTDK